MGLRPVNLMVIIVLIGHYCIHWVHCIDLTNIYNPMYILQIKLKLEKEKRQTRKSISLISKNQLQINISPKLNMKVHQKFIQKSNRKHNFPKRSRT